jgi:hypothetical protein
MWRSAVLHMGSTERHTVQLTTKSIVERHFPQFNTLYGDY